MTRVSRETTRAGFTLVELLVVIGIIVILLAISIPIATRLTAGNRAMSCESHMHKIHQALRMYRLDEGAFPPYIYNPSTNEIDGRGLLALLDTGHISARSTLRCPLDDTDYSQTSVIVPAIYDYGPEDPISYQFEDADALAVVPGTANPMPAFRYQSDRGIPDTDPDYERFPAHFRGPTFQPDDTAVLTWCGFHEKVLTEGGRGQYLVLFYDGRVEKLDADLLRNGDPTTAPPEEAWRTRPGQTGWSGGVPQYP